jgi:hypothetical protein
MRLACLRLGESIVGTSTSRRVVFPTMDFIFNKTNKINYDNNINW